MVDGEAVTCSRWVHHHHCVATTGTMCTRVAAGGPSPSGAVYTVNTLAAAGDRNVNTAVITVPGPDRRPSRGGGRPPTPPSWAPTR